MARAAVAIMSMTSSVPVTAGCATSHTEEIGPFQITSAYFPAGATIPPHTHDRPCLAVMLNGSFDLSFRGGATHACLPGTLAIEPAGETHCNCMGTAGARVLVVQPDPRSAALPGRAAAALLAPRQLRHPGLALLGRRMASEMAAPDEVSPLALEGLALELIAAVARLRDPPRAAAAPPWLRSAEALLRERFRGPITCGEVAADVGVHPAHLARVFRRHYRASIGGYVRTLRMQWAGRELTATDRPIAAIAADAGFADQSHFTRRFRDLTGATPAAWRRSGDRPPRAAPLPNER
jgi:AraC family transcriptional regulator